MRFFLLLLLSRGGRLEQSSHAQQLLVPGSQPNLEFTEPLR
jgi:hypothetical protein